MDTIYAKASGVGQAGIAIIRISGPKALFVLRKLSGKKNWKPRMLSRCWLKDEKDALLDDALAVYFSKGQSYTGEDVVELYVHGGYAILNGVLEYLGRQQGLRLAEAGEFTRRSFENGRMDLIEAEAVADVIHAETAAQKKQALNQLSGSLSRLYEVWRQDLMKALAWYEANIDFSDEEIPPDLEKKVERIVKRLKQDMQEHLGDGQRGEILRKGVQLAIIGAPNVGKSSLLNYLIREEVAIVSNIPGTTRDIVERHLDISGFPVILSDTAGLRETKDHVEQEGIKRANQKASEAHLIIALFDCMQPQDKQTLDIIAKAEVPVLILRTKYDLNPSKSQDIMNHSPIDISLKTQHGLDSFYKQLIQNLEKICAKGEDTIITRQRHRKCVHDIVHALQNFEQNFDTVIKAEDLRMALLALGRLTGRIEVEQLLDVIFADFCIGK